MQSSDLLFAATVLLAASLANLLLFRRAGFGAVLALLATGVIVGPFGLGIGIDAVLGEVTELGVVFLLFLIGLELAPARLWAMRHVVFGLGSAQLLLTGAALTGGLVMFTDLPVPAASLLGLGLALSSTAFVMQLLEEQSAVSSEHGRRAFAVLLLQDLAIVPLLAAVPLLAGRATDLASSTFWLQGLIVVLMLGMVFALGHFVLPRVFDLVAGQRNLEAFGVVSALAVMVAAWSMQVAGLSMALGAFLMGMLLSGSRYLHQIEAEILPFKGLLLSLFFISVGMSVDLGLLARQPLELALALLGLVLVKSGILLLACLAFRTGLSTAIRVALLLPQGGEFGFVLFGTAMTDGLLDADTYHAALLVISMSMALTPLLARLGQTLAERADPRRTGEADGLDELAAEVHRHVVVLGFGRVGRTVAYMLEEAGVPWVAIDLDHRRVELGRREGRPVFFGNAGDANVLRRAGIGSAAAAIVTLDSVQAAERVVSTIRNFYSQVLLIVRARDLANRDRLLAQGVTHVVPETIELSLTLGVTLLQRIGVAEDRIHEVETAVRAENYVNLRLGAIRERLARVRDEGGGPAAGDGDAGN